MSSPPAQLSKKTKVLALSLGQGTASAVSLIVAVVLSRLLSKSDYATYRQTFLVFHFIAPLLALGLPSAIFYFLPASENRRRGILSDCLVLLLTSGTVFCAFLALGGARILAARFQNPALEHTLLLLCPYAIASLAMTIVGPVLIVQERVKRLGVFKTVSAVLVGVAAVAPVLLSKRIELGVLGRSLMTLIVTAVGLLLAVRALPRDSWAPRLRSMNETIRLALPLGLSAAIATLSMELDKVIVSSIATPEEFVVYANGAIEIPFIGIVTGAITAVVLAEMRASIVRGDTAAAIRLFRETAEKSSLILLPAMVFLFIGAEAFFSTLFSEKYIGSAAPFRVYLLLLPIRTIVFGSLLVSLGKTREILLRTVVSLAVNAATSVVLVHVFGPIGAAVATIATTFFWSVPYNLALISRATDTPWHHLIPFADLGRTLAFLALPAAAQLVVVALVEQFPAPIRLAAQALVFGAIVGIWLDKKLALLSLLRDRLSR
jgi:O-antigen/teichoic acid export membrane protein